MPVHSPGNGQPLKLSVIGVLGRLCHSCMENDLDGGTRGGWETREETQAANTELLKPGLRASARTVRPAPSRERKSCLLVIWHFHNPKNLPAPSENGLKYTPIFLHLTGLLYELQYCTWQRSHMSLNLKEVLGLFVTFWKAFLSAFLLSSFRLAHQNTSNQKNAIWKTSSPLSS